MSRNKGAQGEREFAELLSVALKKTIKRKLGAARDGGDDIVVELIDFPAAIIRQGMSFEVKRKEKINLEECMQQALANAPLGKMPVVVTRRNGGRWRACLDIDDFFKLLRIAYNIAD